MQQLKANGSRLALRLPSTYWMLWNVINFSLLVIILGHASTTSQEVMGRYTRSYALGAICAIACSIALLWVSLDKHRLHGLLASSSRRLPQLSKITSYRHLGTLVLIATVVIAALLLTANDSAKWIKVYFVFNTGIFGLLAASQYQSELIQSQKRYAPYLILLLIVVLVGLISAPSVPAQNTDGDEAAWTNYALTWSQTGNLYYKMMGVPSLPITPGVGYGVTLYARWLQIFGVTFASARIFIWLVHLFAVLCIGIAGWNLFDWQVGILSVLLAAASPLLLAQRIVRPEIGLPAIGALLLLFHKASQKRPWLGVLVGWLAVLSLEIHAAGIAYIVGLAGLCAFDTIREWSNQRITIPRHCLAFAVGVLGGVGVYAILHILILSHPAEFLADLQANRQFLTLATKTSALGRTIVVYSDLAPIELLFFAVGLLGLLVRRRPNDVRLFLFWLFTTIGYLLFVPRQGYYLALFTPFAALSIATLLHDRFERNALPLSINGLAIAALLVFCTCGQFISNSILGIAASNNERATAATIEGRIRTLSRPSNVVVGHILSYWGLIDYSNFYASQAEVDPAGRISGEDPYARWQRLAPDVVFHTFYPAWPELPPQLALYIDNMHYRLVDTFSAGGYTTKVWWRPGFELPNP